MMTRIVNTEAELGPTQSSDFVLIKKVELKRLYAKIEEYEKRIKIYEYLLDLENAKSCEK